MGRKNENLEGDPIEGTVYGADLTSTYTDGRIGKYIERLDEVDPASQRFPKRVIE